MNVAALLQDSPSEDRRRSNPDVEKRPWSGPSTTVTTTTTNNTWPPTPAPTTTTTNTTPPTTTNTSGSSSSSVNWPRERERTYHDNHKQPFPPTNSPTRYVPVGDPSPMYEPPARKQNSPLTSPPGDRGKSPWGLAMRPGSTGNNLPMDRDQQWERERDWVRDRNYGHRQVVLPERPPTIKRSSQEEIHYDDEFGPDMHVLQHSRPKSPRQWMPPPPPFTPAERDRMPHLPPPQMMGRHEYPHRQPPSLRPPLRHPRSPRSDAQNNEPLPQKQYQTQFHTSFVSALQQGPPSHHLAPNSRLGSPMPPLFVDPRQDGRPIPHDIRGEREREQRDRERRRANSLATKPKPTREGHRRYDDQRLPYSNPPFPENRDWARERERDRDREQRERERQAQLQQQPPPKRINEPFTGPPPHHPQHYPHPDELDPRLQHHRSSNYAPPPITHRSSGMRVHPAPEPIEWEKEREFKARQMVHVGSFVWPKTPFPYFFPSVTLKPKDAEDSHEGEVKEKENTKPSVESVTNGEKEKETSKEDGKPPLKPSTTPNKPSTPTPPAVTTDNDVVDTDTRTTIYIPSGFLPSSKLNKPVGKIWGGGLNPPPGRVLTLSKSSKSKHRSQVNGHSRTRKGKQKEDGRDDKPQRRRRIYTDDSDLFLCALHSGFVTWSGASKAKSDGMDLKLDVRILRVEGAKVLRSAYSPTQVPARPSSAIGKKDDLKRLRREEVITHFVGGVGERYFGGDRPKLAVETPTTEEEKVLDRTIKIPERDEDVGDTDKALTDGDPVEDWDSDEEDDGRGIESCSWGSGHDGSGIEIVGVEFVKHGTAHKASGLGRQNRSQRMREYALQRSAIFAPQPTVGVKRQRTPPTQMRVPDATVIDLIAAEPEDNENERMIAGPLRCNAEEEGCMKRSVLVAFGEQPWFKYNPQLLKDTFFPSDDEDEIRTKKRKICVSGGGGMDVDGTDDLPPSSRSVLLQSKGQTCYIVSPRGEKQYTVSKLETTSTAEGVRTVLWNDLSEDQLHFSNEGLSVRDALDLITVQRWKWTT